MPLVRCMQIYASLMMYSHNCTQFKAMSIGWARTITITLIARIINEKLAALGYHHTLKHYLH